MTVQPQINNLNYLIDPTLTNVNRLFVLSFPRIAGENNTTTTTKTLWPLFMDGVQLP